MYITHLPNKTIPWSLALLVGLVLLLSTSLGASADSPAISRPGMTPGIAGGSFADQNPEFAKLIGQVDGVYQGTEEFQSYFLACGGVGTPTFGCGLASDFYDQLANRYGLPKQEVENPAMFRAQAAADLSRLQKALDDLKVKKKVCVSFGVGPFKKKECITVSFPGSLDHFLNKVPNFPGASELKKKVREAFDDAKSAYEKAADVYRQQIPSFQDLVNRLDQVQRAIDDENKKVSDKAIQLATSQLERVIDPALEPVLKSTSEVFAAYVSKLDEGYVRGQVEVALADARAGTTPAAFEKFFQDLDRQAKQLIQAGADPLDVTSLDLTVRLYHLMTVCGPRATAEDAKSCAQTQLAQELLILSEDVAHSIYTHTARRLLYEPCSAQLADDVTTEAAADTFGISCLAYKSLQNAIQSVVTQAGDMVYNDTIEPIVESFVEEQLKASADAMAQRVVAPIPRPAFQLPGQTNAPIQVKSCTAGEARVALADGTCIVPLEKMYIYSWFGATQSCNLLYGSPLCSLQQVQEGQQRGYSWCANSWTATTAGITSKLAYRVTPMSVEAEGCPPIGVNSVVESLNSQYSGLCCVPIAK